MGMGVRPGSRYAEAIGLPARMCQAKFILDGETVAVCTRPKGNHRKHWMEAPMFPRISWPTAKKDGAA